MYKRIAVRRAVRTIATGAALGAVLGAFSLPAISASAQGGPAGAPRSAWQPPADDHWAGHGTDPANLAACDPIDPAQCMLPYPNDWFTRPDLTSRTGRRLDLVLAGMPRNAINKPIQPEEWNRNDGFSAGSQILTLVPGMTRNEDLVPSGLPPVTDLAMNSLPDLGVVLLDTRTGERVPVWVEVDQYTTEAGPVPSGTVQQDLMIHPAVNLTDGHRYIVALRHLVRDDGTQAPPSVAFQSYRDGTAANSDPRKAHMEGIFQTLQQAGVGRGDLYLAWDFTTASTVNITGRLLAIRNDAFRQLGDTNLADGMVAGTAPQFSIGNVENFTPTQDKNVTRRVSGHFTVPCYIFPSCAPPELVPCATITQGIFSYCGLPDRFAPSPLNPDAVPQQTASPNDTYQANFICNISRSAYDAHQKMRPVEYGHGLFGGAGEVNSDPQETMAARFGMMYCATDWFGMASPDVPNAIVALNDLSNFPTLTDRVQQGELNFLFLAREMVHPQGFGLNEAFRFPDHTSVIDTRAAYYDGNSQGGIFGGTVCAVSVDVRRCVLGVLGMDYSVLLPRSSDYVANKPLASYDPTAFSPGDPTGQIGYSDVFDTAYPNQAQRMLILDLIQNLWDRSDPDGYATHMTSGLPQTPPHHVLLQAGYGDHQVANITAETEARTIGAHGFYPPLVCPRYAPYKDPFWNIPAIAPGDLPYDGSAITLFDTGPVRPVPAGGANGTNPPPIADVPNRSGSDPHEAPRRAPWGQVQKANFLALNGRVTNPQPGGAPYFASGWDGVAGLANPGCPSSSTPASLGPRSSAVVRNPLPNTNSGAPGVWVVLGIIAGIAGATLHLAPRALRYLR